MADTSGTEGELEFIRRCFRQRKIVWTYHVNMRLGQRSITREQIIGSLETLQIIENYRDDRCLPCYLLFARHEGKAMHIVVAVDEPGDNVRIVTAYEPGPDQWDASLKTRRKRG